VRITAAEGEILKVLWRSADSMTSAEVIAEVGAAADVERLWEVRTVRTFLARLVKANVVGVERSAGQYRYRAAVSWKENVRQEVESLIDRLFLGDRLLLVTHLLERHSVNQRELDDLKRLVTSIESQQ